MTLREGTKRTFLDGVVVELWENPDVGFDSGARALAGYVRDGAWELLFNGIMLNADHEPSLVEGFFKAPLSSSRTPSA